MIGSVAILLVVYVEMMMTSIMKTHIIVINYQRVCRLVRD